MERVYALSGVLKCDLYGSTYAGNAGFYRCNAKVNAGRACPNNAIAQDKADEAIFTLLGEHILKYRSIKPVIEAVKRKRGQGVSRMQAQQGVADVDDDAIRSVIETLGEQVRNADPKVRRRAALNLFQELQIGPKTRSPWVRKITAKGIHMPLTGAFVASPRGFEPLLPT